MCFPSKVVQTVLVSCISRSRGQTLRPGAFIFDVQHHLEVLYQYLVDNISGPL